MMMRMKRVLGSVSGSGNDNSGKVVFVLCV